MSLTRRAALGTVAASGFARYARAQSIIRIGVLTDLSGPYSSLSGPNSGPNGVAAARLAAAEFMAAVPSIRVEVVAAELRRRW
jgi:branched-chain amino acid transport system substrate-binding protein